MSRREALVHSLLFLSLFNIPVATALAMNSLAVAVITQYETLYPPNDLLEGIQGRVIRRKESVSKPLQDSLFARERAE